MEDLNKIREELLDFYNTKKTLDYSFRIKALKNLKRMVCENIDLINEALLKDLNKTEYETYLTEISMLYSEIDYFIKNLNRLMKPKKVGYSLTTMPARGYIYNEPYGLVLIMSPWNYPLQLSLIPLADAIAAGNVVILKMSEFSVNTTNLLNELISKYFPKSYIRVVMGAKDVSEALLDLRYDKIFFTGSKNVGRIVLSKAAKYLTPCDLELGGKSPVIVTSNADLRLTAKRLLWGKLLNSGQTCVAPDYALVDESIYENLLKYMFKYLDEFLGSYPLESLEYPKIINEKSYLRLKSFIDPKLVALGGKYNDDTLKIEPTILLNPSLDSKVMTEEIFGPILPIITYKKLSDAYDIVKGMEKPLALYIFTDNKEEQRYLLDLPFGGASVNDTILHMTPLNLPFGGVGESGMGSYHGIYSFKAFSHEKSVLKAKKCFDINLRYHPYLNKIKLLKKLFK